MNKIIDYTNNEKFDETIDLNLDQFAQEEYMEIYIKLWGDTVSNLNININHLNKKTLSRVKVRAVLRDSAKLAINGLVNIEKGMSGTDSYFDAKILTLSPKAVGAVTPALNIDEDDVKAGHAASITNISERDMFYLQSRGVRKEDAEKLIEDGFLKK